MIRDERITTHLALISRLFDVRKFLLADIEDKGLKQNIKKLQNIWGGNLDLQVKINPSKYITNWKLSKGFIVHLTMYGEKFDDEILKKLKTHKKLLIIVGSQKVPFKYYELSDLNLSIGNQPHSELSALTILLYELLGRKKDFLYRDFKNSKQKIIPSSKSKKIVNVD
ncbi:MAG: tRNA (cytidine(56)-2'-O)-methyltransferase [Candidatus Helarchaeota archaeon]